MTREQIEEKYNISIPQIELRIAAIREAARRGDNEDAHASEDELHFNALEAIAAGHPDSKGVAELVIQTNKIDYERWYA